MNTHTTATLRYRGYTARIDYDDVDRIFVGRLTGVPDIVVCHGNSVAALQTAMQQSVDDYLAACEARTLQRTVA